jgi:uncharacterized caspase-like protein
MGKNWAICIGINHYSNLPELSYAVKDAEAIKDWCGKEGFDNIYLFTDDSEEICDADRPYASQPTYGTLMRFLRNRFQSPFMNNGDNLWFFFSGHGLRKGERDYLMPNDSDPHPDGIEQTAISLSYVTERLRRSGADNIVLFLDACRSQDNAKGLGIGEERQQGVITFASCSPAERSFEIDHIQHGAFTYALLETLQIRGEGNCATVERLYQRLRFRVAEINQRYQKPRQTPYAIIEPASKYHLILLSAQATLQDVMLLKLDAQNAEIEGEIELSIQLWIRILATSPADPQALRALERIWGKRPPPRLELPKNEPDSSPKDLRVKAYWLFQGSPKHYRMLDAIRDLEEIPWPLKRYQNRISVGDEALIWVAGKNSGIYALGKIIKPVEDFKEVTDIDYWIDTNLLERLRTEAGPVIRFTHKLLNQPLLRDNVLKDSILKNLPIFRFRQGSIFEITPEHWQRVYELVGSEFSSDGQDFY